MEKYTGKKINTSIFISGRGSNLSSLIKYSKLKKTKINIKLVISDNQFAKGLNIAKKNKIKTVIVKYKEKKPKELSKFIITR